MHDYDPESDYTLDPTPPKEVADASRTFVEKSLRLRDALGIRTPQLYFVRKSGSLAKFIAGTSSSPVIVVDARSIRAEAKRRRVLLSHAVASTLLHEYGHAYLESADLHFSPDEEEEIAEEFVRTFFVEDAYDAVDYLRSLR